MESRKQDDFAGRMLPKITPMNEYFWTAGRDGVLRFMHCPCCDHFWHPYVGRCPRCASNDVAPKAVSGRGVVVGFTVNHQAWIPGIDVPYVVALIAIDEQDDIRLLSDMCDYDPNAISIGTPVEVYFIEKEGIYLPLFRPSQD